MAYNLKKLKFLGSYWTNFDYDHLDRHQNLQDYFNSKKNLFNNSKITVPKLLSTKKKFIFFKSQNIWKFINEITKQFNIKKKVNISYLLSKIPPIALNML